MGKDCSQGKARRLERILPVLSVLSVVAAWQLVSWANPTVLPSPWETVRALAEMLFLPNSEAGLPAHIWASLSRVLTAYVIALVIGISLGVLFGWSERFHDYVYPVFELLRPIPPIAWIPLVIMWFGVGEASKITICVIGALVPIVANTFFGVSTLDPTWLKAGKMLGARRRDLLLEIIIPGALPSILAGMKTALSSGWVCIIASEMIAAKKGLGNLIVRSMESGNMVRILAALIVIGSISAAFSWLFTRLERTVCQW